MTTSRPQRMPTERLNCIRTRCEGAALLLVLWLIALMTALVGAFALTARIEHLQGRVLAQGIVAEQAARAGMEYAMTRVIDLDPNRLWVADGREHPWRYGAAEVTVTITDESGKLDLNSADATLLAGLFQAAGADRDRARRLASATLDWRDGDNLTQPEGGAEDGDYASAELPYGAKDAPFETIAELQLVLGMTPALYDALAGAITVYSGQGQPNPTYAGALVLRAMGMDAERILAERKQPQAPGQGGALVGVGTGTYSIESRARLRDGRVSVMRAVLRAGGSGLPGSAYTPLRWEQGALAR